MSLRGVSSSGFSEDAHADNSGGALCLESREAYRTGDD